MKISKLQFAAISMITTMAISLVIPNFVKAASVDEDTVYHLGSVVNAGKDDGYSKNDKIAKDDPHYGWELGEFSITGYTSKVKDENVFLKTVGDKITLSFTLNQNIDKLNGDENLVIADDKKGYDTEFQIDKTDFGRGTLIIQKTDYQNNTEKPQIYKNYLTGINKGAETQVDVFEEGDYQVALDYRIRDKKITIFGKTLRSTYLDYRIAFKFSVRNGNCMVFPFDIKTGDELINKSITPNGFKLDLAQSHYLDINVKKELLAEGADALSEDVRFNRPAKDGDEYTDEGIYTITVKNNYTNEETEKKIYVGSDKVMMAYMTTGYSIKDIKDLIANGATVDDDGQITIPEKEEEPEVVEEISESGVVTHEADELNPESNSSKLNDNIYSGINNKIKIVIPIIVVIIVVLFVFITIYKKRKKAKLLRQLEEDNDVKNEGESVTEDDNQGDAE